ncbi:hypothetical protein BSL78_10457 [Apostichopus japonicus]|uniref:Uncharacterized protein n=1 Tax=Stichopus japonicus TaxID=307972 RepID=A0A2G8KXC5_STIJA|nr:hypothetical protein BSL78_10457 [Apostichopus japonicus]
MWRADTNDKYQDEPGWGDKGDGDRLADFLVGPEALRDENRRPTVGRSYELADERGEAWGDEDRRPLMNQGYKRTAREDALEASRWQPRGGPREQMVMQQPTEAYESAPAYDRGRFRTNELRPGMRPGYPWREEGNNRRLSMSNDEKISRQRMWHPQYEPQAPNLSVSRVTAPSFNGSTPWEDYIVQFELISELNGWDERTRALQLAASLRGPAQAVLADLDASKRRRFESLTDALEQRFGRANQTELFRTLLRNRTRQQGESIPELAHDIQRLLSRAYPNASIEMKETLSKEFFIDAISDRDIRWKIYQSRPKTLEEAVSIAAELEAFTLSEQRKDTQKRAVVRVVSEKTEGQENKCGAIDDISKTLATAMTEGFSELTKQLQKLLLVNNTNVSKEGQERRKLSNAGTVERWAIFGGTVLPP